MSSKNVIDLRRGVPKTPPRSESIRPLPERQAPRLQSQQGRRISPVRAKRRRTRYIILGVIVLLLALLTYGVSWASYLPRYTIDTVTIVGTDQVPQADVYDYVESLLHTSGHPFLSRDNIFLYNPKTIARALVGNFPRIASATVTRASLFATAITVTVTERQPYALWCTDDTHADCYQMDDTGFIFAQGNPAAIPVTTSDSSSTAATSSSTSGQAGSAPAPQPAPANQASQRYIFEGGLGFATSSAPVTDSKNSPQAGSGQVATSTAANASASSTALAALSIAAPSDPIGYTFVGAHMPGIVALLQLLGQAGFTPTGATVESDQDFLVPLTPSQAGGHGFYIKASFGEDPGSIVSNLQLVLSSDALAGKESELQYVDLRFGDRVYYKLQGASQTQTSS